MKRRKKLARKTSLRPRVASARKTHTARKPRSAAEFARIYGSEERVGWIKARWCIKCGKTPCENAHLPSRSGMGRKGDYTPIVPLCHTCHEAKVYMANPAWWRSVAAWTERLWQIELARRGTRA